MTLWASIDRLHHELGSLRETLEAASRRALDTPRDRELHLAQTLADEADVMAGWAAEAEQQIAQTQPREAPREQPDRVHDRLTAAQRRAIRIGRQLDELLSYDRVADMLAAAREGGAAWRDWAGEVRDSFEAARAQLRRVERRLFSSWQELSEPGGAGRVSVTTTSVGQLSVAGAPEQPAGAPHEWSTRGGASHGQ